MIRANCLFFEVTGETKFLTEAQRIARSASARWIVPESGAVKDGGRFAHLLLESLVAVGRIDRDASWLHSVSKSIEFVRNNVRDPDGRYAHRWDKAQSRPLESFQLIDQASAARAYFFAAQAVRKAGNNAPATAPSHAASE
jgi:mannose/cellobiose epimerase-like protein (N-acyl-D-glucosamine 2-epimerase family)